MSRRPFLVPRAALLQSLKMLAEHLGLSPLMAGACAEAHLAEDNILSNWNAFLTDNCAKCAQNIDSCALFHPEVVHGATKEELTGKLEAMIGAGLMMNCPAQTKG